MSDPELEAMQKIHEAFEQLKEEDARTRVLRWAPGRYGGAARTQEGTKISLAPDVSTDGIEFPDFARLLEKTNPSTESECALVAGYWYQVCQSNPDFDSQTINAELKQYGKPVSNITRAFDALISQDPRLVMQVRKAGTSRQARKRYKLTTQGVGRVKQMMAGAAGNN